MRLCRFDSDRLGVVKDDMVFDVTAALDVLAVATYPLPRVDLLIQNLDRVRGRIEEILPSATAHALADVTLLSPVANPGKLVAAPVNNLLSTSRPNSSVPSQCAAPGLASLRVKFSPSGSYGVHTAPRNAAHRSVPVSTTPRTALGDSGVIGHSLSGRTLDTADPPPD